ncbi:MAG TPA: manganese efflux pump [Streptosporangiaceae bacterium]|nr:manganese efflux pump [Streptosporangiaceae bacterium]
MLALALVAVALGLSNFAASVGMGIGGVHGGLRVRVAVVFGLFEAGMPVLGLALGYGVTHSLGHAARWLGGGILILVGCWGAVQGAIQARREQSAGTAGTAGAVTAAGAGTAGTGAGAGAVAERRWRLGRLLVSGFALSVDNLAAGFALGAYHVSLGVAAALFGVVSVGMSLAGLELGARLGAAFGPRSELAAGAVLIVVGASMAGGVI